MHGSDNYRGLPGLAIAGFGALVCLGIGAFVAGVIGAPQRTWAHLLVLSYYLLGVGLGGGVLLALFWVTGARWSTALRPATNKLIALLPAGAVGVALVLLARPSLYPWIGIEAEGQMDVGFQSLWLSRPFFLCRAFIYFGLWLVFAFFLVRGSRRENPNEAGVGDAKKTRLSAAFLVVFALTCWLASTDWIMSLEPKWSSTIFGVYNFTGIFLSALAGLIVLAIWLDHQGVVQGG